MADDEHPTADFEPPHPNGAGPQPGRRSHPPWEIVILFLLVALVCVGIILAWTLVGAHSPERLDTSAVLAVARACDDAQHQLSVLPNPSPVLGQDRVLRIRSENTILRAMVARFTATHPTATTPADALKGWSNDWTRLIDARARYANDLDDAAATPDKKIKFVLPAASGIKPVTEKMNGFVRENHPRLDPCFTDALQAERVEGPREYKKVTS